MSFDDGYRETLPSEEGIVGFLGALFAYALLISLSIFGTYPYNIFCVLYLVIGIITVCLKIYFAVQDDKDTTLSREVFYGLNTWDDNIFLSLLIWPGEYLRFFFHFVCHSCVRLSYRDSFLDAQYEELFKKRRGMSKDTMFDIVRSRRAEADQDGDILGTKAREFAQNIQEVPSLACKTAVIATACTVTSSARSQNIIPDLAIGGVKAQSYGWVSNTMDHRFSDDGNDATDFDWKIFRLRTKLTFANNPFGAYAELELAHADNRATNWLRQLFVMYAPAKDWELRLGRLFLAPGYVVPPPFLLETVRAPRVPHNAFGYGFQAEGKIFGDTRLIFDLATQSGRIYDETENWEGAEANIRLQKPFEELGLTLATTTQCALDFSTFSSDAVWKPNGGFKLKTTLYDRVDYSGDGNTLGGYFFAGAYPAFWLEVHSQIDYQEISDDSNSGSYIVTNGIRLWTPNNQLSITLDHELKADEQFRHTEHALLGRLQIRF